MRVIVLLSSLLICVSFTNEPVALAIESLDNNTLIPRTLDNMTFLFTNSTFLQKVLMSFGYIVWGSLKKCLAPQKRSVSLSLRPTF
ncbi:hypothetical protein AAZX31_18G129800 [Glycine max]